jgi:hypothetical protein
MLKFGLPTDLGLNGLSNLKRIIKQSLLSGDLVRSPTQVSRAGPESRLRRGRAERDTACNLIAMFLQPKISVKNLT